jgi:hypothetical protein
MSRWIDLDIKALIGGIINMGLQLTPDIKDYSSTKWVAHILFLIMFLIDVIVLLCWNLRFTHDNDNGIKQKITS